MRLSGSKTLALGAAVTAATGGLVGVTASPANADACPDRALCAYLEVNYQGDPGTVYGDNRDLLQYTKFDNAASLFNNGKSCQVRVFASKGYTGATVLIPMGYGYTDLRTQNPPLYKNVASNYWVC